MDEPVKDIRIAIRVSKQLAEEIKECARQDRRTASDWARIALEEKVKEYHRINFPAKKSREAPPQPAQEESA